MMQSVKGIYRDGKVELLEPPAGIAEGGEVIVTFVEAKPKDKPSKMMRLGMFSSEKTGRALSTEEDFKMAEFHGDDDDGLDWT